MRGSSACGNPVRLLQKPRLGFGGACGAGGRSWGWNLRVSGGRTQISRVPEVEEGSLDPSPRATWSQRKGRSTVVTLTCVSNDDNWGLSLTRSWSGVTAGAKGLWRSLSGPTGWCGRREREESWILRLETGKGKLVGPGKPR